jgi:hypothetical protein
MALIGCLIVGYSSQDDEKECLESVMNRPPEGECRTQAQLDIEIEVPRQERTGETNAPPLSLHPWLPLRQPTRSEAATDNQQTLHAMRSELSSANSKYKGTSEWDTCYGRCRDLTSHDVNNITRQSAMAVLRRNFPTLPEAKKHDMATLASRYRALVTQTVSVMRELDDSFLQARSLQRTHSGVVACVLFCTVDVLRAACVRDARCPSAMDQTYLETALLRLPTGQTEYDCTGTWISRRELIRPGSTAEEFDGKIDTTDRHAHTQIHACTCAREHLRAQIHIPAHDQGTLPLTTRA